MGITYFKLKIKRSEDSKDERELRFFVDSGSTYTFVPKSILNELKVKPTHTRSFLLANGEEIERRMGSAYFSLDNISSAAPVVFGEKDDETLLGATTLEALGLMLNPIKRTLEPLKLTM